MAGHYGAELKRDPGGLCNSEEQYRLLFESNPLPMWVFDRQSLRFLAVNDAAIHKYGFTEREFLSMTIAEIRPAEDVTALIEDVRKHRAGLQDPDVWRHRKKNGENIDVEVVCHSLEFHGIDAMLVCAQDITERTRAAEKVRNSETRYHGLFEESADANFLVSEGKLLDWNSAALRTHAASDSDVATEPGRWHALQDGRRTTGCRRNSKRQGAFRVVASAQGWQCFSGGGLPDSTDLERPTVDAVYRPRHN
jgi:PAS domain S-box-containing protein